MNIHLKNNTTLSFIALTKLLMSTSTTKIYFPKKSNQYIHIIYLKIIRSFKIKPH